MSIRFGVGSVFMDVESTPPGVVFRAWILDSISMSQAVLVIIGPQWLSAGDQYGNRRIDDPGDHVRFEIETALRTPTLIIPITVTNATMPGESDLPESIRSLTTLNAQQVRSSPTDFHHDMDRLVKVIEKCRSR